MEEEEESQTLFNSKAGKGEEPQLEEMLPSLDIDEECDTSPSLADASASMKRQIQTELKEAVVVPSTQAIPPQPMVTPVKSDPSKACLASTSPPLEATHTSTELTSNLSKVASLQQSPTPPATSTPSRVSKSIVIMDSDGDWTVGGKETPLFKSKAGTTKKLKKPIKFKKLNGSSPPESLLRTKDCGLFSQSPTTTPTKHPNVSEHDMAATGGESGQAQTSPLLPTSPLADCSPTQSSLPATGFSTLSENKYDFKSSWGSADQVQFKTSRKFKVSPNDVKEVKKVEKDNLPPPQNNILQAPTIEVLHRYGTNEQVNT